MSKRKMIISVLIGLSIVSACESSEQASNQPGVSKDNRPSLSKAAATVAPEEKIKADFLSKVKPGMKEQEARALFGTDFQLLENVMDGNETWRYDMGARKGYEFEDQGIDQVDLNGLKEDQLDQILFLDWNEDGQLKSGALFMPSSNQTSFIEYRLLSDGRIEEIITPF